MESTSVFVGNIPYDVTEEQLVNLFRQFGDIQRFRLQLDNGGKGKGYGFCDFVTVESAEAAKRMNNFISINGRQLRVDSATQPTGTNVVPATSASIAAKQQQAAAVPSAGSSSTTAGTTGTTGTTTTSYQHTSKAAKELDDALRQLTYGEAYHILEEVRVWIKRDPDGAREVLKERPTLANALLKINMKMAGLTYPPPADMYFGQVPSAPPPSSSSSQYQPPPSQYHQQPAAAHAYGQQQQQHAYGGYAPPQQQQSSQDSLVQSILALSDAEVAALNPDEQVNVRKIRDYYRQHGAAAAGGRPM